MIWIILLPIVWLLSRFGFISDNVTGTLAILLLITFPSIIFFEYLWAKSYNLYHKGYGFTAHASYQVKSADNTVDWLTDRLGSLYGTQVETTTARMITKLKVTSNKRLSDPDKRFQAVLLVITFVIPNDSRNIDIYVGESYIYKPGFFENLDYTKGTFVTTGTFSRCKNELKTLIDSLKP